MPQSPLREFVVDLSSVKSLDDFVAAFNTGFCQHVGGDCGNRKLNLDAFNDYLYWPEEKHFRLIFRGWHQCDSVFAAIHPPSGKSYAEQFSEIFADNTQAEIVLE